MVLFIMMNIENTSWKVRAYGFCSRVVKYNETNERGFASEWVRESVNEILKSGNANESYWAVLPYHSVYYAIQGGPNFWVCEICEIPWSMTIEMKAIE